MNDFIEKNLTGFSLKEMCLNWEEFIQEEKNA